MIVTFQVSLNFKGKIRRRFVKDPRNHIFYSVKKFVFHSYCI